MKSYKDFNVEADGIFEKIRREGKLVSEEGVLPDPVLGKSGYGVVLRYPSHITSQVEDISGRLYVDVGGIKYGAWNMYTSVCIHGMDEYTYSPQLHNPILARVAGVVRGLVERAGDKQGGEYWVLFNKIIYNQTTVIAPGKFSRRLYSLVASIVEGCQGVVSEFREPWAAFATIHRFAKSFSRSKLGGFFKLMDVPDGQLAFGECNPLCFDVVFFVSSSQAFVMATVDRIYLFREA